MKVSLQLFASVREAVGASALDLQVDEGSRLSDLKLRLGRDYPTLLNLLPTVAFAIDDEYVSADEPLHDGAEVSLIPPVSGGATEVLGPDDYFRLTHDPIEAFAPALAELVRSNADGAVALFYGVVRNNSDDRDVERLEYEAKESMAVRYMRQAAEETKRQFPDIGAVAVWHRVGMLEVGETSLLVAVASPHRKEAFEACHWAVDRIKQIVPVWKKEHWVGGGAEWVPGYTVDTPETTHP